MDSPAVIQGTYADYRRVKGRKVLQLVVEVPIEQAPQVHQIFGEPSPDGSTWVAVALLDAEKARPMTGLYSQLSPEQQQAALEYRGPENHGDDSLRNRATAKDYSRRVTTPADGRNGSGGASHRLAQQAGILCADARFRRFLAESIVGDDVTGPDHAAEVVRHECEVKSRAELDSNPEAATRWEFLHSCYVAWLHAP